MRKSEAKPRATRSRLKDIQRRSKYKTSEDSGVLQTKFRYMRHAKEFSELIEVSGGHVIGIDNAGPYRYKDGPSELPVSVKYTIDEQISNYIMGRCGLDDLEGIEGDPPFSYGGFHSAHGLGRSIDVE